MECTGYIEEFAASWNVVGIEGIAPSTKPVDNKANKTDWNSE